MEINQLQKVTAQVRRDIVRMVHACQSGHPGGSLGCTDIVTALYFSVMKLKEDKNAEGFINFDMDAKNEDVFLLSNGHISPLFYSVLSRRGYFDIKELTTFRKLNSRLQGHPATHEHLPGIRIASGSLGQGLSVACGVALAKKMNGEDNFVYVLMGDGEQNEGQIWEAAQFAPHYKLKNLIAIVDVNGQQIDGATKDVMDNRDLGAKYKAFGWTVLDMNGNDLEDILATFQRAIEDAHHTNGPVAIMARTNMGHGVDFMMGSHHWHGIAPNDEQLAKALEQLEETLGDY